MGGGVSRAQVQHWLDDGLVAVNGSPVKQSYRMRSGDEAEVRVPEAAPAEAAPEDLPLEIVYQDADVCVINKSAGVVVHPAQGHHDGTLVNALLFHVKDLSGIGGTLKPGIVHRLDKGTSGLMVVCKNDRSHAELQRQFAGREVSKKYLAVIYGGHTDATPGIGRNFHQGSTTGNAQ
jgi:23S rRNA pseudouridine1911/1915/1917 synthase